MSNSKERNSLIIPQTNNLKSFLYKEIISSSNLSDILRLSKEKDNNIDYIYRDDNRNTTIDRGDYIVILPDLPTLSDITSGTTKFVQEWILLLYSKTRQREITFDINDYFAWRKTVQDSGPRRLDFFNSLKTLRKCSYDARTKNRAFNAVGSSFISDYKMEGDFVTVELGKYFKEDFLDITHSIAYYPTRMAWLDADKDKTAIQICRYLYPMASMNYKGKGKPSPYVSISKVLENTDLPTEENVRSQHASPAKRIMDPFFNALFKLDEEGSEIMFFELLNPETKQLLSDEDFYSIVLPGSKEYPNYNLFKKCLLAYQFYDYDSSGAKTKEERRSRRADRFIKASKDSRKEKKE